MCGQRQVESPETDVVTQEEPQPNADPIMFISRVAAEKYLREMLPEFLKFAQVAGLPQTQKLLEVAIFTSATETPGASPNSFSRL